MFPPDANGQNADSANRAERPFARLHRIRRKRPRSL
jgi:hypothetical protein